MATAKDVCASIEIEPKLIAPKYVSNIGILVNFQIHLYILPVANRLTILTAGSTSEISIDLVVGTNSN